MYLTYHLYELHNQRFNVIWIEGEGGRVKRRRVELNENKLILDQIYSILFSFPPSPSIQMVFGRKCRRWKGFISNVWQRITLVQ